MKTCCPAPRYARAVRHFYREARIKLIPPEGGFKDFPGLLEFRLRAGRRAFALFQDAVQTRLKRGVLSTYRITHLAIFPDFTLSEIALPGVETDAPPL